ncbi:hypothetical protein WJX79_001422 [Trebouxia sp. C0005]
MTDTVMNMSSSGNGQLNTQDKVQVNAVPKINAIREWFHHEELFIDEGFTRQDWIYHRSWRRHLPEGFAFIRWAEDAGAPKIFTHQNAVRSQRYYIALLLTSFAVGLLIVFRTNSSYARWWEARTHWGGMLGITRNIMRQCACWFPEEQQDKLAAVARWTAVLTPLLKMHCRWQTDVHIQLKDRLLSHELAYMISVKHPPNMAATVLTQLIASANLPEMLQISVDKQIVQYIDSVAACESLQKQPIPVAYTRHTSRFLLWWLTGFPFAAWSSYGWVTPFVTAVVTFLLLGVENIGIQIEEPFEVLPIEAITAACIASVHEILERHHECKELLRR